MKTLQFLIIIIAFLFLIISVSYTKVIAESTTSTYEISGEFYNYLDKKLYNHTYNIPYKITNADLQKMYFDPVDYFLKITIKAKSNGVMELILPRQVLDSKIPANNEDYKYFVMIGDSEAKSVIQDSSECFRKLKFNFAKDDTEISIFAGNGLLGVESILTKGCPPLKQLRSDEITPQQINCKIGYDKLLKYSNVMPICVKQASVTKLVKWGWAKPLESRL